MDYRVSIQWTETAKEHLKKLPPKVRKGLLEKADELLKRDPRKRFKPLTGPLRGYFRMPYSRYRAVYLVQEEVLSSGDVLLHLKVIFVVAGIRKKRDKQDVYRVAEKIVRLVLDDDDDEEDELEDVSGMDDD